LAEHLESPVFATPQCCNRLASIHRRESRNLIYAYGTYNGALGPTYGPSFGIGAYMEPIWSLSDPCPYGPWRLHDMGPTYMGVHGASTILGPRGMGHGWAL
jgi:hypothetical protein